MTANSNGLRPRLSSLTWQARLRPLTGQLTAVTPLWRTALPPITSLGYFLSPRPERPTVGTRGQRSGFRPVLTFAAPPPQVWTTHPSALVHPPSSPALRLVLDLLKNPPATGTTVVILDIVLRTVPPPIKTAHVRRQTLSTFRRSLETVSGNVSSASLTCPEDVPSGGWDSEKHPGHPLQGQMSTFRHLKLPAK